mmetsp:Transcript_41851/g.94149  ORF Transcript_41851/g.94149 Transcript_41851/m.94149 type:complete len:213 (-) Transcript_41851:76-714(-)
MAPSAIAIAQLEDRMGNGRKDAQRRLPAKVWALVAVMVIVHSVCSICDRPSDLNGWVPAACFSLPTRKSRPDFNGKWILEKVTGQKDFMKAVGYNFVIVQTASLARITQTIVQKGDVLDFTFEVVPPVFVPPQRHTRVQAGGAEVTMVDDAGREMVLWNSTWAGEVFTSDLRYVKPRHNLKFQRYLENGRMVEHVRYPQKQVEMKRIFKKQK